MVGRTDSRSPAAGIDCAFEGFGFQAPLLIRLAVRPFRNGILVKPMRAGFRLPKRGAILLPNDIVSIEHALARLERCTERLKVEDPTHLHPVLGNPSDAGLSAIASAAFGTPFGVYCADSLNLTAIRQSMGEKWENREVQGA